ncbi:MAG: hypothetical protein KatS3mg076_2682 [Candidatus Binatia bacterium]|nr:MAG: hypothetical protein KatS3mg076_2682 [Candidatus Binatia bacterium]
MGFRVKDWPREDRPREKLLEKGPGALSVAELLAVVLRNGSRQEGVVEQCRSLLRRFEHDLHRLGRATVAEIRETRGFGPVKAAQILAVFELARRYGEVEFRPGAAFRSSFDVYAHFRERLAHEKRERFYAVLLDNKNQKIREILVSEGSLTASLVHPRDVFAPVVRESAAAVVFVHNHPSGDPTPSPEDLEVTRRLRQVGELVGVRVLDHIVVGRGRYVSFAEHGYW